MPVLLTTGPSLPSEEIRDGRRRIVADGRIRSDVTVRGKILIVGGKNRSTLFFFFQAPVVVTLLDDTTLELLRLKFDLATKQIQIRNFEVRSNLGKDPKYYYC